MSSIPKSRARCAAAHVPRIAALDGLRGLAALIVLISHLANAGHLPSVLGNGFGQTGVLLFFGLSGFLMGMLYLPHEPTRQTLKTYAVQRLGRVLPLYGLVVIISYLAFRNGIATDLAFPIETGPDLAAHLLGLRGVDVLWSIPVELQFYGVFACLWLIVARLPPATLLIAPLCLYFGVAILWATDRLTDPYALPVWLPVFATGTVLGWLHAAGHLPRPSSTRVNRCLGLAAIAALLLLPPELRRSIGLPVSRPFIDPLTLALCATLAAATLTDTGFARLLETRPFRWLGQISFGLYLLHMPVLHAFDDASPGVGIAIAITGLSVVLAQLSLTLIERPAQHLARRAAGPQTPPAARRSSTSGSAIAGQRARPRTVP